MSSQITDQDLRKFLLEKVSCSLRCVDDDAHLANRVNGMWKLNGVAHVTTAAQIGRVILTMTYAEKRRPLQ